MQATVWISFVVPVVATMLCSPQTTAKSLSKSQLQRELTNLHEVSLKSGANNVQMGNFHTVIFVAGYKAGNGGDSTFFVTTHDSDTNNHKQLDIVAIAVPGIGLQETVSDAPHDGETVRKSVRFLRAKLDGESANLLVTAERKLEHALDAAARVPVKITVYRLMPGDYETSAPEFDPIAQFETQQWYCNTDTALFKELKIPLPLGYAFPNPRKAC